MSSDEFSASSPAKNGERLLVLVQHGFDVLAIVDENAVVQYVSPSITDVLGYTPEEFIGINGFAKNATAESACRELIDLANDNGGKDNITVIVSRFFEPTLKDPPDFVEAEVPLEHLTAAGNDTSKTAASASNVVAPRILRES